MLELLRRIESMGAFCCDPVTATVIGAGASLGGSILSSSKQASAAKSAANTQSAAADAGIAEQRREFDINQENQKPFLQTGTSANAELARQLGVGGDATSSGYGSMSKPFTASDFTADPGYAFRLQQGQQAIDRSAAAKGGLLSGAAVKAGNAYNSGQASQEYQSAYDRYNTNQTNLYNKLSGVSGGGQVAANALGTAGQNSANAISGLLTQQGAYNASGTVGSANAWASGLGSLQTPVNGGFSAFGSSMGLNGGFDPTSGITWNSGRVGA